MEEEEEEEQGWWVDGVEMDDGEGKCCSNELLTSFTPLSGRWAK